MNLGTGCFMGFHRAGVHHPTGSITGSRRASAGPTLRQPSPPIHLIQDARQSQVLAHLDLTRDRELPERCLVSRCSRPCHPRARRCCLLDRTELLRMIPAGIGYADTT